MKRVVQTTLGVVFVLLAAAAIALGSVLLAAFGRDGTVSVSSQPIRGDGAALVTEDLDVAGTPLQQRLGTLSFGARSDDGVPLFLGLGGTDDVFTYLDGVPYDVVAGVGSSTVTLRPVPGEQVPVAPAQQRFWHAQALGKDPEFAWPADTGEGQRLVVMNANGARGVGATLTVTFRSTTVFPLAVGAFITGGVLLLLGLLLLVLAVRGRRRARAAAAPAPVLLTELPPPAAPNGGTTPDEGAR